MMYLKFICFAIISFIVIQFTGCDKEDLIINPQNDIITFLNGKIENWTEGSNKILKLGKPGSLSFFDFGYSPVDLNGNFDLELNHPSDSIMYPIVDWFRVDSSMNLQIDHSQTKGIDSYLNIFSDSISEPIGQVTFSNDSQNNGKGYFSVSYIYSEGDLQIIGLITTEHNVANFNGTQDTYYNIHFNKGWNKLVYKVLEEIKSGGITTYYKDEWSNEISENGKWYYRLY